MKLEHEILKKEKSLLTVEVRHSTEKLLNLMSEDFREIGASGAIFGIKEVLSRLPEEENWSCQTSDWAFREVCRDVVQVTFRALIKHSGGDEGSYSHRSSIWRREEGDWKLFFHQGTKVDADDVKS